MAIDMNLAQSKYQTNTPASANVWAQRAAQAANKWKQNATSQQAEANYATGVQQAVAQRSREAGIQVVSPQEYAQAIQQSTGVFQLKTQNSAAKWAQGFAPAAQVIDRVVSGLAPRQAGNAAANVQNRVLPIAVALQDAKQAGALRRAGGTSFASPIGGQVSGAQPLIF